MPEVARPPMAIEIFFSYAHEDEGLKKQLVKHLRILEREGVVKVWHDRKIMAGGEWGAEISTHLERADIILLLVSTDFIDSDYCYSIEMARAIERHRAGEARVIPVILRPCLWKSASFSGLSALPKDGMPCTDRAVWEDADAAFLNVAEGLQDAIRQMRGEAEPPAGDEGIDEQAADENYDQTQEDLLSLLPYLCDRNPQDQDLVTALMSPVEAQSTYPFLCIIYGGEEECHDKFRERLQKRTLKDTLHGLGLSIPSDSVTDFRLMLPSLDGRVKRMSDEKQQEAFVQGLRMNLAKELLGNYTASRGELIAAISQYKSPVIVHSNLSTAMWEPDGPKIVNWFLGFWNDSWVMPQGPHLFICLHIEFDRKREEFIANEEKVRKFLESLDDPSLFEKLHVASLSELDPVPFLDAKAWAGNEKDFEGFCQRHGPRFCDANAVILELVELYRQPDYVDSKGRIPMLKLAPRLRSIIQTKYCQRNSP